MNRIFVILLVVGVAVSSVHPKKSEAVKENVNKKREAKEDIPIPIPVSPIQVQPISEIASIQDQIAPIPIQSQNAQIAALLQAQADPSQVAALQASVIPRLSSAIQRQAQLLQQALSAPNQQIQQQVIAQALAANQAGIGDIQLALPAAVPLLQEQARLLLEAQRQQNPSAIAELINQAQALNAEANAWTSSRQQQLSSSQLAPSPLIAQLMGQQIPIQSQIPQIALLQAQDPSQAAALQASIIPRLSSGIQREAQLLQQALSAPNQQIQQQAIAQALAANQAGIQDVQLALPAAVPLLQEQARLLLEAQRQQNPSAIAELINQAQALNAQANAWAAARQQQLARSSIASSPLIAQLLGQQIPSSIAQSQIAQVQALPKLISLIQQQNQAIQQAQLQAQLAPQSQAQPQAIVQALALIQQGQGDIQAVSSSAIPILQEQARLLMEAQRSQNPIVQSELLAQALALNAQAGAWAGQRAASEGPLSQILARQQIQPILPQQLIVNPQIQQQLLSQNLLGQQQAQIQAQLLQQILRQQALQQLG